MNLELNVENHLTFEIANIGKLNPYKIFLILKSNDSSYNMFFEEIGRDLEKNTVKFTLHIKSEKILSQIYKIYLAIFHNSENIFEEILIDDVLLVSNSPVNLISIPSNKRSVNLTSKTYEVEIPLENILLRKESSK